jgi:hypothetical protein
MLRQSVGGTLSRSIRRESSMRQPYQPRALIYEQRHRAADETSTGGVWTPQCDRASAEPSLIVRAMSWLGSAILEGFALYGQSMGPCLLDFPEDHTAQAEEAERTATTPLQPHESPWLLPGRPSHDIDIQAWLASAPSHSRRNRRRGLHVVAVGPTRCNVAAERSLRNEPAVLDHRSQCNGGVDHDDTGPIRRWFDPFC